MGRIRREVRSASISSRSGFQVPRKMASERRWIREWRRSENKKEKHEKPNTGNRKQRWPPTRKRRKKKKRKRRKRLNRRKSRNIDRNPRQMVHRTQPDIGIKYTELNRSRR